MPIVEVPWRRLPPESLNNLMESFINREGTDYGTTELSLLEKLSRLRCQIELEQVIIFYDDETDSCHLVESHLKPKYV